MLSLPPEILDLIVDHLHDEPTTLKACCLVSKSWVWRTRWHLFFHVEFNTAESSFEKWMKVFQEPSNSPAHHTRTLSIFGPEVVAAASADRRAWIHPFRHITTLSVDMKDTPGVSLVHLHGLSPTLISLGLFHPTIPPSEVINLICSFPLLEDLYLSSLRIEGDTDKWKVPPTSPKLTGSLYVSGGLGSVARRLLDLPSGLRSTMLTVMGFVEDVEPAMGLVSGCSATLKSLRVGYIARSAPSRRPPPLNLSKATKLQDLLFRWGGLNIQWIITTLETAQLKTLRQITFHSHAVFPLDPTEEVIQMWQDLDRLLNSLRTSHSVSSKIIHEDDPGGVASRLLPELTKRGAVHAARG